MVDLDYRILLGFFREAQRKEIEKTLNTITAHRAAMANKEEYLSVVKELKSRMNEIQVGQRATVLSNWEDIKKRG